MPLVVAGEFWGQMLAEDIQVKGGEALRQTLHMLVVESAREITGKSLVYKVHNQSLMAVMARKGSTRILALNQIGKQILVATVRRILLKTGECQI